jgi:hypothetical protein
MLATGTLGAAILLGLIRLLDETTISRMWVMPIAVIEVVGLGGSLATLLLYSLFTFITKKVLIVKSGYYRWPNDKKEIISFGCLISIPLIIAVIPLFRYLLKG